MLLYEKYNGRPTPVSPKHLYNIYTKLDQRRRRWADVVQILFKYFVYAGTRKMFILREYEK